MRFRSVEGSRARVLAVVAAVAAAVVVAPAPASAVPPAHVPFESHDVFVDSEVCAPEGFSVDVVQDEVTDIQINFDRSGEVSSFVAHVDYRAVISANGKTIVERDKWKDTFYADGTAKTVGNSVHIQGVGPGLVQHDAGQIFFNADGSVTIHGPHPQFEGQTFCFALLP